MAREISQRRPPILKDIPITARNKHKSQNKQTEAGLTNSKQYLLQNWKTEQLIYTGNKQGKCMIKCILKIHLLSKNINTGVGISSWNPYQQSQ